ncbi:MAG: uroporphyrinogen-III synthase [Pseudomonadota bacterium]
MFLITRPSDKANQTKSMFDSIGLEAFVCPAQKIVPLRPHFNNQTNYQIAIVTSTYAAHWFVTQDLNVDHIIAIGNATKQTIREHLQYHHCNILVPDKKNSEGVLDMTLLSSIENQNVLLVKGVDGRDLLEKTIKQRRANLSVLETYRRQSNISELLIRQVEELPIKCIIVTSTEIAALIIQHFPDKWLAGKTWIVASERIAAFLRERNHSQISVSQGASDTALIEAATQLDEKNGNTS